MDWSIMNDTHSDLISQLIRTFGDPTFRAEMSPFFFNYLGGRITSAEAIKCEFNVDLRLFNYLKMKNKSILDIGCGFGQHLVNFALLGARKCTGIDLAPEMIRDFRTLASWFDLDIEAISGDFLDLEFAEESFDIALMRESISHVRDTQRLLINAKTILTPRGCVCITDNNNSLFLPQNFKVRRIWKKQEHGPIDAKTAAGWKEISRLPYRDARAVIIQSRYPSLDETVVSQLAKKTQGLFGEEIIQAVEEYMKEGTISKKPSFQYRNPYTGEYPELCFNPWALMSNLKKMGFECRLVSPSQTFACFELSPIKRSILKTYRGLVRRSPLIITPFIYPTFRIIGRKLS
jgi:SAM-dependent methyltransferase